MSIGIVTRTDGPICSFELGIRSTSRFRVRKTQLSTGTRNPPIKAYSLVLEIYKKEQLPQNWAMTQSNLGSALNDLAVLLYWQAPFRR